MLKSAASTNDSSFATNCGAAEQAQTVASYGHVGLTATVSCACELILLFFIVYCRVRNGRKVGLRLATNLTVNKYQVTVTDFERRENTLQRNSERQTTVPTHAIKVTAVFVRRGQ